MRRSEKCIEAPDKMTVKRTLTQPNSASTDRRQTAETKEEGWRG